MTVTFGPLAWLLFGAIVVTMLVIDLRGDPRHHTGLRVASLRSILWILVGLGLVARGLPSVAPLYRMRTPVDISHLHNR